MPGKISIITVTYNAEKFLEKTIQSVFCQNATNFEYLIIDGNSKDATLDIIKKYDLKIKQGDFDSINGSNFKWISEQDKGLYDAMNKGLDMATGDFVWFINAGDKIYDCFTLQKINRLIEKKPFCDIVYGQSLIIDENDNPLGERHKIAPHNLSKNNLLKGLVVCHQSILVRRSIVPEYDLKYKVVADYDWVIKVVSVSKQNEYINDYLSKFMIAGFSTINRKKAWQERFFVMKNHFGLIRTLFAHALIVLKYPFTRKY